VGTCGFHPERTPSTVPSVRFDPLHSAGSITVRPRCISETIASRTTAAGEFTDTVGRLELTARPGLDAFPLPLRTGPGEIWTAKGRNTGIAPRERRMRSAPRAWICGTLISTKYSIPNSGGACRSPPRSQASVSLSPNLWHRTRGRTGRVRKRPAKRHRPRRGTRSRGRNCRHGLADYPQPSRRSGFGRRDPLPEAFVG
jgi:hypothetical protein